MKTDDFINVIPVILNKENVDAMANIFNPIHLYRDEHKIVVNLDEKESSFYRTTFKAALFKN